MVSTRSRKPCLGNDDGSIPSPSANESRMIHIVAYCRDDESGAAYPAWVVRDADSATADPPAQHPRRVKLPVGPSVPAIIPSTVARIPRR
jgi:hypothetical protein